MSEMVKELHVVTLPLSAFGHLMPFFQLSIALAKAKVHVSFISTPRNIERLPKIPPDLQPFINLVPIPFPPLEPDFLPEGAEASFDVPEQQEQQYANLQVAVDLLQTPIKQFIADKMPDWIIADFFTHWVVDIAKEYDVPLAYFSVFSAAACVFFGPPEHLTGATRNGVLPTIQSLTSPPEWITFPSLLALKDYEAVKRLLSWEVNKTGMSLNRRLAKIVSASQVLAIRTCSEIEGDYLEVYKKITGKPVIPTGVLPPDQPGKRAEGEVNSDASMFDWLDKQKPRSVVFVGFGSECMLSKEQVHEIAHGLELSELPFIWGLRKPHSTRSDEVDDFLPLGFVDRTSEKGLVCFGWVPQMEILGHPSIRGSLFHSGWGSVIETLQFGHCLVVLPFMYDQPLNARLLVEKGLAAEVKRNEDGSFSREEIAKSLRLAMVEEEGEQLRSNARKAAAVIGDQKQQHDHYIGAFVNYLKNNVAK
ncbi:PREDICTED: putative UDP-rhamnose:rhamnosyltransferase 1 isoform X1 [Fragaria vesca subsp. vesca]|uniref:putative UDP-rhamnose:rhamnosyltransferase 1 isoform X1 n=1 Tax=Fragaria vesca subsp. vesca TaxID=101020 RepID=UPI0002C2EC06|nr:PREDICTED: putative UDP-rhamnose:rhamnosyltransferase 1 isoform X1 [Fragaria vesca subsp. vesca]